MIESTSYGPDLRRELFAPQIIANALNQSGDRPLIEMIGGETYSVVEVRDRVSAFIQALAKLDVAKGDRVAMLSTNRVEVVTVGLAAQIMGVCMVALHPLGAVDDYEYIIRDFDIRALVFDPGKMIPRAEALAERFGGALQLLSMGPAPRRSRGRRCPGRRPTC